MDTTTREQNKAIARRYILDFWNERHLVAADELFAPDASYPDSPELPSGPDGVKASANTLFNAFPDLKTQLLYVVAGGDCVAVRSLKEGTHQGEILGVPASGKQASWTEIDWLQIEDGKIVKTWFQPDLLTMLQQIGGVSSGS